MRIYLLTILLLLIPLRIFAADVTGYVRHANTWQELSRVNVYVKDSGIGTATDRAGFFSLQIARPDSNMIVVIQHISFYPLEIPLTLMQQQKIFYLIPRVIPIPEITVVDKRNQPDISRDIPQSYTTISARQFDTRGYIDAGDLLRTEQSIQVDEELSGKKTVAVRAGNADDVTVLYNGIRMNNIYDNTFDLSMINLEDVERLEIIRGSNTALYGAEAIAGLINIVPKNEKSYTARFAQKFGTYASGDWTVQFYRNIRRRLNLSYSFKQEGMQREYSDEQADGGQTLENFKSFHSASIIYNLPRDRTLNTSSLSFMYLRSKLEFSDHRYNETLDDVNQLVSLRYSNSNSLNLVGSYQWLDNGQNLATYHSGDFSGAFNDFGQSSHQTFMDRDTNILEKKLANRTLSLHLEKGITFSQLEWIGAYQYENGTLDYYDEGLISQGASDAGSVIFSRQKHGAASIIKLHVPTGSQFYRYTDFALTCRYDRLSDDIGESSTPKTWQATTVKFSSAVAAKSNDIAVNAFLNFCSNVKFPTMFQQVSSPGFMGAEKGKLFLASLYPEKNSTAEIGVEIIRALVNRYGMDGVQLNLNYFKNQYTNKLVTYYTPRTPVAYYENVHSAAISGVELKTGLLFLNNKLSIQAGTCMYSIPEKSAFPFKSDRKHTVDLIIEHAGFGLDLLWFYESEQTAWVRGMQSELWDVNLPAYGSIDFHISKSLRVSRFKLFLNFSGRNLLDDDTELEGIAIRDKRFYLTFGAQY